MIKKILFVMLYVACSASSQNNHSIDELIQKTREKFAPDKRTEIFSIEYKSDNGVLTLDGETSSAKAKDYLLELIGDDVKMTDNIEVLPQDELKDKVYGVINLSVANLRSNPKHPAELATQSLLGTPVKVYKKDGWWFYIQTPDEYLAWADDDGVCLMNEKEYSNWIKADKIIITSDYTHAYSGPESKSSRVSDLVAGNLLKYKGNKEGFYAVEYPDGRKGFVGMEDAQLYDEWLKKTDPSAEAILEKAYSFLGIPYLWGGTSIKGMDCSGFTKTVFHLNGIILKRDASQQVYTGELVTEEIDFDKLKPGDLLFFGKKANGDKKERITHVGLYVGDTEFLHASGRVKVNSLDSSRENFSEYRFKSFIRAKRVLSSVNKNGIETFLTNKFYTGEK